MTDPAAAGLRRRAPRRWRLALILVGAVLAAGSAALVLVLSIWLRDLPKIPGPDALWTVRRSPGVRFLDHDGVFIAARGARYGARVTLADLPPFVPRAFLAAEDRRFYSHGALDPRGLLRAAGRDLMLGRPAEGGSTLSQQLARTLFLSQTHTLERKVQEAILASRLEGLLGKDAELELYLNRAYFGSGAYGLDAAAHAYFGKPAGALTLAEAAVLAAVPNAPTRLAPTRDMAAAWARARRILAAMRDEGWIGADEAAAAAAAAPPLAPPRRGEGDWSYVLDQAAARATEVAGEATDLVVRLTIDSGLQAEAVASVRTEVDGRGRARGVSQGALVALAPDGAIRALVGGLDHQASAFNRVSQARRQPGSAFKAFVFAAAMEAGLKPTDTRRDAPIVLGAWAPENYGGRFSGPVTLARALALSINSVAVRLTLEVGPAQVAAFARRCGLADIPADPGPSIALGAYEVTLLELAGGYQVFQNGGSRTAPYLVESVADTAGARLYTHDAAPPAGVLDPLYASRMTRMLEGVITGGTGAAAAIGRVAAGKTGTSQNWRDAWFVGFTPDLLAAVWVGNDDGRPMKGVTGGEIPAAIWRRFMTAAETRTPPTDFAWLVAEPPAEPADPPDARAPAAERAPDLDSEPRVPADWTATPEDDRPAPPATDPLSATPPMP